MPKWMAALPLLFLLPACGEQASPQPSPTKDASIQSIMAELVDPSADEIWAAIGTVETAEGTRTATPRSPEDWNKLEDHARRIVEAARRLDTLPRAVPAGAEVADADTVGTRTGPEIDKDIAADPAAFRAEVKTLDNVAREILGGIARRDATQVFAAGERLDAACDSCHVKYWHPRTRPRRLLDAAEFEKHRL